MATFDVYRQAGLLASKNLFNVIPRHLNKHVKQRPGFIDRKGTYEYFLNRYEAFRATKLPSFSVFIEGNSKLPFMSFSALPGKYTCPGAGECLEHCYSIRSWRYPAVFFRQLQNEELRRTKWGQQIIAESLPHNIDTVRLYVDGDFYSSSDVDFWMSLIKERPNTNFYGYSKSAVELLEYHKKGGTFPPNYKLNLSSGGIREDLYDELRKIPGLVRGDFIAIKINGKRKVMSKVTAEDIKTIRSTAKNMGHSKVFVCPGKCGSCVKKTQNNKRVNSHACGDSRYDGISIVIPVH